MRCVVVVCSVLAVCAAAVTTDVKKVSSSTATATAASVDTFHCTPNSNVAVIKSKILPIYVCRLGDVSYVLAAEGHPQAHLDVTLDHEAVKSLSDVYVKRTGPVKRQKRQWGGGGFGGGFSGSHAESGSISGGGGFGPSPFGFPGGGFGGGGGGGGFSHAGASAGSTGVGFGGFGR